MESNSSSSFSFSLRFALFLFLSYFTICFSSAWWGLAFIFATFFAANFASRFFKSYSTFDLASNFVCFFSFILLWLLPWLVVISFWVSVGSTGSSLVSFLSLPSFYLILCFFPRLWVRSSIVLSYSMSLQSLTEILLDLIFLVSPVPMSTNISSSAGALRISSLFCLRTSFFYSSAYFFYFSSLKFLFWSLRASSRAKSAINPRWPVSCMLFKYLTVKSAISGS